MRPIIKTVKSPIDSKVLIKCVTQTIENETKNWVDFLV